MHTDSDKKKVVRPLLAIDIGNSSINVGIFSDSLIVERLDTYPLLSPAGYSETLRGILEEKGMDKAPEGVVISSVVPGHTEAVSAGARELTGKEPLIVGPKEAMGLKFDIKVPEELGTDRIAAAVAGLELFGPPLAVVDFGTATTVSFTGRDNVYKGGTILPGLRLMGHALSRQTARLPDVEFKRSMTLSSGTVAPLGKNTENAILSGIIFGTAGAVERIIAEVQELEGETYKVVATGGYMEFVLPYIGKVDFVEPALTLKGLKLIYEKNR